MSTTVRHASSGSTLKLTTLRRRHLSQMGVTMSPDLALRQKNVQPALVAFLSNPINLGPCPSSSQSRRSISSCPLGAHQRALGHYERRDCCRVAYAANRRHGRQPLVLVDYVRTHQPRREPTHRLGDDPGRGPAAVRRGLAGVAREGGPARSNDETIVRQ